MTDERPDVDAGDAAEDDTVSMAADISDAEPTTTPTRRRGSLMSLVALVAAFAALACSGVLFWQYRQFYVSLADADAQAQASLERVRAAATVSEQSIEDISGSVDEQSLQLVDLRDRLDALPGEFSRLQQRVDAIQGGSFDARNQWLEAEAEYYLSVANSELQLGGRWENALAALRLADDRLREAGDPGLATVRAQIADDILAIESVRLTDIEGTAHSLSRLGARVDQLPLRIGSAEQPSTTGAADEPEPGLERLWSGIRDAFSSIVQIERTDEPLAAALTAEEARLIRRQLSAELQTARLALVGGESAVFVASLERSDELLRAEFDLAAADVEGALRLLESLSDLNIAPQAPDISRSLYALRARGAQ